VKLFESSVTLQAKVAFLRLPASYPDRTSRVEAIETHMSWVSLLDNHVYKLKKPICMDLMDCRTLNLRHYLCDEEVRLNLRLAPRGYLGVTTLTMDEHAHLALAGDGKPVDWLVKMCRLRADSMLDYAILHQTLAGDQIRRLALYLTGFYRSQPPAMLDFQSYKARFALRTDAHRRELSCDLYRFPPDQIHRLYEAQKANLHALAGLLEQRVTGQHIVEGHGDLRPEHVSFHPELAIIDCLEFSRDLRTVDAIDEFGFLALECERLGAPAVGAALLHQYRLVSADTAEPRLIHFYQSCRASTRAVLAAS
jgi:aminoglycoside phosphotransferase family enzyme